MLTNGCIFVGAASVGDPGISGEADAPADGPASSLFPVGASATPSVFAAVADDASAGAAPDVDAFTTPAGWVPTFPDYLSLGFWTATAFSPTDVSAIRPWAKLLMMTEAAVSLAIATLVIARAINILA